MPSAYDNRDKNEPEIIRAFEVLGCVVVQLKEGRKSGVPDLLVGMNGAWILVEVKNKSGRNRLSPEQQDFMTLCEYRRLPAHVVRSVRDVEDLVGAKV